ncbi:MAG: single-stranded DNA-binding protein [Deltaproteobacteria bacterium]|jgi:single-strand DNA-binding protein
MSNFNKVMLMGNLGADPEMRYTQGGTAVANFRIATTERWKDADGEMKERTDWHRIVVWGKQGETCGEHLRRGRSVFVEGRLQNREWEDKDGNKRWTTEVKADRVLFLAEGSKGRGETYEPVPGEEEIPF